MPNFPKSLPDVPSSLDGFRLSALVHDDGTTVTVQLVVSVAIVSAGGQVHQVSDELGQYLSPGQVTASPAPVLGAGVTNAATALYAKAKVDLLS